MKEVDIYCDWIDCAHQINNKKQKGFGLVDASDEESENDDDFIAKNPTQMKPMTEKSSIDQARPSKVVKDESDEESKEADPEKRSTKSPSALIDLNNIHSASMYEASTKPLKKTTSSDSKTEIKVDIKENEASRNQHDESQDSLESDLF